MLNREYPDQICSVARALEAVGERWSLLIVRDALLGLRRFDEFLASLAITRSMLSARLAHLVDEGLLERRRYQSRPDRFEYLPTAKAKELFPVIAGLAKWGDRHYPEPEGPPRLFEHRGCGGLMNDDLYCDRCGQRLRHGDVCAFPGPALTKRGRAREGDGA